MFTEHVVNCIDDIIDDVMESESEDLQSLIKGVCNQLNKEDQRNMMRKGIIASMTLTLSQGILDDEFFEAALIQNLDFILKRIPYMKRSMILKVELEGLEDKVNRIIEVPYGIILADLCYLILASMNVEGGHLFTIYVNGEGRFGCDACDPEFIDDYAGDITIPELEIQTDDEMELLYDFGDNYIFNIEVIDMVEHEHIQSIEDVQMIDGTGYGIWEDEHALLDLYYADRQNFFQQIEEYELDEDDFIFEDFDTNTYNEMIIEDFEYLKSVYEMPEDFEG